MRSEIRGIQARNIRTAEHSSSRLSGATQTRGAARLLPVFLLVLLFTLAAAESGTAENWELRVCATENNLPYSGREDPGFENHIAEMLAAEMGAEVAYTWLPYDRNPELDGALLQEGECDLFMGVVDGQDPYLTTVSYYQSTFMFITRGESGTGPESLDDPELHGMTIGVLRGNSADHALARRGIIENVHHFAVTEPADSINRAVAAGELDAGIVWGPTAAYFSGDRQEGLVLTPVLPQVDVPYLPMVISVAIGVRRSDTALRDRLNRALAGRWDEVQEILGDYRVPLLPLPRPRAGTEGN